MPSQIRPNRLEVSDRFPMLGFTIKTDGEGKRYEVVIASDAALFRSDAKPKRTKGNFYSSRAAGLQPIDRGEAVYVLPPEVLARFVGQDKLYYALATYSNGTTTGAEITPLPSEGSAYINLKGLSGRSLKRVRVLPSRQRAAASYGNGAGTELEWAGDIATPGTQPVSSAAPAPTPPNGKNGKSGVAAPTGPGASQAAALAYNDGFGPLPWAHPQEAADQIDDHGIDGPIPDQSPAAIPEQQAYSSALQDSEYPQASRFAPAASNNYRSVSTPRTINRVVIHITDGGSKISGTIGWFQNPDQRDRNGKHITVSAHYVIGQDGEVVQMVKHNDVAWHANSANSDSIGIEHCARQPRAFGAKDPGLFPTEAQYCASAALVRWLCDNLGIPIDRDHVLGHSEADTRTTHTDCPNAVWDWDYFMGMVTSGTCYSRADAPASQGLSSSYSGYGSGRASAYQPQGYGLALEEDIYSSEAGFSFGMVCGESINDRIVRCCRQALADGPMGEKDRHDFYRDFISAGQEKSTEAAEALTHVRTSCAMFVRAVRLFCGATPGGPYVPGTGMFVSMGNVNFQHPAFVALTSGATPNPGDFFYISSSQSSNDGHTGIFLAPTNDGAWETAEGGGGDGTLCRINSRQISGNKFSNDPRTLWGWFDCTKIALPASPACATGDNPGSSEGTSGYQTAQSLGARDYASSRARAFDAPMLEPGDVVKAGGKTYIIYANEVRRGGVYAWINNNPGNITKGKWSEEHGALVGKSHGGFAIFPDETTGFYAIIAFIERFPEDTIYRLMTRYAPPDDGKNPMLKGNNPQAYADSIAKKLGVPTTTQIKDLSDEQKSIFATEIQRIETGANGAGTIYAYNDPALPEEIRNRLPAPPETGSDSSADSSTESAAESLGYNGGGVIARSAAAYGGEAFARKRNRTAALADESFSLNWDEVELIPQPNNFTCWATAASMVIGWRDRVSLTPETVAQICGRSTASGLSQDDRRKFASEIGLQAEGPQSYTIDGFRNLLESYGPLWVSVQLPGSGHAIVVTGMYSDGAADGSDTFVRISDPWDRVVGTPGSPGAYLSTHNTGSRYIMSWAAFTSEYEQRASSAADGTVNVQILHAAGTDGRQPSRSGAAGYAMAAGLSYGRAGVRPPPPPAPVARARSMGGGPAAEVATTIVGAVIEKVINHDGKITWELDQLRGLKHPNDTAPSPAPAFRDAPTIRLNDWPYVDALDQDRISAWFSVDWQFNGKSVGNVQIANIGTNGAWLQGLEVQARIMDDNIVYPRENPTFAALRIRFHYRFTRAIGSDWIATTELHLFGDGTFEKTGRWEQS